MALGGAVCRNWRRSGHRLQGFGRAQLGRGPGITGTAHDRTSRRQPPDRPEHSSPRKNRAARCPHRRPRQLTNQQMCPAALAAEASVGTFRARDRAVWRRGDAAGRVWAPRLAVRTALGGEEGGGEEGGRDCQRLAGSRTFCSEKCPFLPCAGRRSQRPCPAAVLIQLCITGICLR